MIRAFQRRDTERVVELWSAAGLTRPWNDPHKDIERKLGTQPELFLVFEAGEDHEGDASGGDVVGTAMIGYDGHRGWVYYLAVDASQRGRGIARALMAEAERLLVERGCPKLMLMVRADNTAVLDLYEHLGYAVESTKVLGKRLIAD